MSFDLSQRIHRNTNDNQESSTSKVERDTELLNKNSRENTHCRDVNGPAESDTAEDLVNVFGRSPTWPNTRNKATVFLHVFSNIYRIEHDSRVKETEEDNEADIHR